MQRTSSQLAPRRRYIDVYCFNFLDSYRVHAGICEHKQSLTAKLLQGPSGKRRRRHRKRGKQGAVAVVPNTQHGGRRAIFREVVCAIRLRHVAPALHIGSRLLCLGCLLRKVSSSYPLPLPNCLSSSSVCPVAAALEPNTPILFCRPEQAKRPRSRAKFPAAGPRQTDEPCKSRTEGEGEFPPGEPDLIADVRSEEGRAVRAQAQQSNTGIR